MSWQSIKTKGVSTPKELYEGMQSKGVEPIVLKWRTPLRTIQNVYGLTGFALKYDLDTSGLKHMTAEIDPKEIVTFQPDEYGEAWAVIPKTDKNVELLRTISNLPWVVFEPKNLMDGVKAASEPSTKNGEKKKVAQLRVSDLISIPAA